MTKLLIRPALLQDASRLELREEDLAEMALYDETPTVGLRRSIRESRPCAYAVFEGTTLVALGGVARIGERLSPWLMCSKRMQAHPRALLRACRYMVGWMRFSGDHVGNFVGKASTSNQRFLRHLGFVIEAAPGDPGFDYFYLPE